MGTIASFKLCVGEIFLSLLFNSPWNLWNIIWNIIFVSDLTNQIFQQIVSSTRIRKQEYYLLICRESNSEK